MDDPDWMNDFKTPSATVLMLSSSSPSSSPSREVPGKRDQFFSTGGGIWETNGKDGSDDEVNPPISSLRAGGAAKKGRKRVSSKPLETEISPVKKPAKRGRKAVVSSQETDENGKKAPKRSRGKKNGALESEEEDDDDEEKSPQRSKGRKKGASESEEEYEDDEEKPKPSRGRKKRTLESEEEDDDDEEYQTPSKKRKTSASPQVKKMPGVAKATPKGRKGRKVSFSEDEGTPQPKRAQLEKPEAIEEEGREIPPILSLLEKTDAGPTAAAPTVSLEGVDDSKPDTLLSEARGSTAQAFLRGPSVTAIDGEDGLVIKEETTHEEETGEVSERKVKPRASSTLPVILAEKVHRTKVLLECEGDALDLSGDMGAVGRFSVSSGKGISEDELLLDLKGILYKTTIVPSNTFFVVNVGHAEAKLRPDLNQAQDETVVEGTLEGFAFDLDNDGEPQSTPAAAPGAAGSEDDDDTNPKKKKAAKALKQKKVAGKGGKGSRTKGTGKGASKKPRAKSKATGKKPPKPKSSKKS